MIDCDSFTTRYVNRKYKLWLSMGLIWVASFCATLVRPRLGIIISILFVSAISILFIFFGLNGVLSTKRIIPVLIVISVLLPYIRMPEGIPDIRPEYIIITIALYLMVLGHLAGKRIHIRPNHTYKWIAIFGLSTILSIAYSTLFKGQAFVNRDFFELIKLFIYFSVFALIANQRIDYSELNRYFVLILLVFALSVILGFLQYLNIPIINKTITPYYTPTQLTGVLVSKRVTGTMPNPNEFGALMALAISLALSGILVIRKKNIKVLCLTLFPVYGLGLILSQSRSALMSTALSCAVIVFLFLGQERLKRKFSRILAIALIVLIIMAFFIKVLPTEMFSRFSELSEYNALLSWQNRVMSYKINISIWLESPWFGWGPRKLDQGMIDNEWLLILRRYGVLGFTVFLCLCTSLFLGLFRIRKLSIDQTTIALSIALQAIFLGYILYMFVAGIYHTMQLMTILLLLLGLVYSQEMRVST